MRNCKNCNQEFEPKSKKAEFCSDKCRVAFNRKKEKEERYNISTNSDHVITFGDELEVTKPEIQVIVHENGKTETPAWVSYLLSQIEEICNKENITPEQFIQQWADMKKELNNKPKSTKVFIETTANSEKTSDKSLSKFQLDIRKKKLGW